MPARQPPRCSSLIICDGVYVEPASQKHMILGVFDNIQTKSFPALCRFTVHFELTDGMGEWDLQLRVAHADEIFEDETAEPIEPCNLRMNFAEPHDTLRGFVMFQGKIPKAGVYHLELVVPEIELATRSANASNTQNEQHPVLQAKRFTVVEIPSPNHGD